MTEAPMLEVEHLVHHYTLASRLRRSRRRVTVHAVDDVSFSLARGETLGVVGESGCGKSTLARCVVRLLTPTSGTIRYGGVDITRMSGRELQPLRGDIQMVFQDPRSSLNPRRRIRESVGAAVRIAGVENADARVAELLDVVGLDPRIGRRFPHEVSGGQRQRVGIARALGADPKLIVLDEPVSALDVSIQAQLINLLDDLQDAFGLSYIFVAHDLAVVRHASRRIAVMYLGKLVEVAAADDLFASPHHPYTSALIGAIPVPEARHGRPRRRRDVLAGEPPSPISPPGGCRFHPRCPRATTVCAREEPPLVDSGSGHLFACHHPMNVDTPAKEAKERHERV
jgi:oligopeptide/dipeptide ABC transporter ATP-binding protein